MSTILDQIVANTQQILAQKHQKIPLKTLKQQAQSLGNDGSFAFYHRLNQSGIGFICEIKKASPSKGIIATEFDPIAIARAYEAAGADAISCLTEPKWFLGCDDYIPQIAKAVSLPILRKDFVIDEYMIYEAKVLGASAILLICSLLDVPTLTQWRLLAESLGMDTLIEAHNEAEVNMALQSGGRIIGVNNRNLKDFDVDVNNSTKYRAMVPEGIIFVSESGISTREDIVILQNNKTDAVLIGESLMRADDKKAALNYLKGIDN